MIDIVLEGRPASLVGMPGQGADASPLLALLRHLDATGYRFVTVTPATHGRVMARYGGTPGRSREDVLGWSRPFEPGTIDREIEQWLLEAGAVERQVNGLFRSRVRVSMIRDRLFLHSAYPTDDADAVFLGPDSYRFANLIAAVLARAPVEPDDLIVDIGTGAGVGAIVAADLTPGSSVLMTDINPQALALARINAAAAHCSASFRAGRDLELNQPAGLVMANPPYIIDPASRAYRHGGGERGGDVSVEMARVALAALKPGGRFILYTGSAIVSGEDRLQARLADLAQDNGYTMRYREIDPDVFGEELELDHYADVDRIALVAAIMTRSL